MDIRFEKREHLKEKPDQKHLGFGKYMTDYMFVMDWTKEEGSKEAGKTEQKGRFLQGEDRSAGRQSKASDGRVRELP